MAAIAFVHGPPSAVSLSPFSLTREHLQKRLPSRRTLLLEGVIAFVRLSDNSRNLSCKRGEDAPNGHDLHRTEAFLPRPSQPLLLQPLPINTASKCASRRLPRAPCSRRLPVRLKFSWDKAKQFALKRCQSSLLRSHGLQKAPSHSVSGHRRGEAYRGGGHRPWVGPLYMSVFVSCYG